MASKCFRRSRTTGCRQEKSHRLRNHHGGASHQRFKAEGSRLTREGNDEQPDPVSPEHRKKRAGTTIVGTATAETMAASTAPSNPATLARPPPERHKITCSAPHGHAGKARRRALKNGARDSRPKRQRHGCDGPGPPSLRRAETPLWFSARAGGTTSALPPQDGRPFRRSRRNWSGRPAGWPRCLRHCGPAR